MDHADPLGARGPGVCVATGEKGRCLFSSDSFYAEDNGPR